MRRIAGHVPSRKQTRHPSQLLLRPQLRSRAEHYGRLEIRHRYPVHGLKEDECPHALSKMNQRTRQSPASPDPQEEEVDSEIASIRAESKPSPQQHARESTLTECTKSTTSNAASASYQPVSSPQPPSKPCSANRLHHFQPNQPSTKISRRSPPQQANTQPQITIASHSGQQHSPSRIRRALRAVRTCSACALISVLGMAGSQSRTMSS